MMRTKSAHPEAKEKILEAAQTLMLGRGYNATTVDEICQAARLTKGSFFHYFKSKEHLGRELLERFCCCSFKKLGEVCSCQKEKDPLKRVYAYLDFMIKLSKDPMMAKGCLLGTLSQELSDTNPRMREVCAKGFAEWAEFLKRDLRAAKEKYAPKARFDPATLADHLIAVIEGSQILAKARQNPNILARNLDHFKQYLETLYARKT